MRRILATMLFILIATNAQAGLITYEGDTVINSGNCIPFGCPDSFGSHMGFVYQNIAAFDLKVGDTIAFDLTGSTNLNFDLALGSTLTNGGWNADISSFMTVSSISGSYGDGTLGTYDLVFEATQAFSFSGGGLIIDFFDRGGSSGAGNFGMSSDNPYDVRRYFRGISTGDMSNAGLNDGRTTVANFELNIMSTSVPEPSTIAIFGLGLLGLVARAKKRS